MNLQVTILTRKESEINLHFNLTASVCKQIVRYENAISTRYLVATIGISHRLSPCKNVNIDPFLENLQLYVLELTESMNSLIHVIFLLEQCAITYM